MFDAARDQRPAMRTLLRTRALPPRAHARPRSRDRKSTRLNSSHLVISYAVFCLKKKKQIESLSQPSIDNFRCKDAFPFRDPLYNDGGRREVIDGCSLESLGTDQPKRSYAHSVDI